MHAADWFTEFFQGVATDLWTLFASPEMTAAEAEFFVAQLQLQPGASVLDVPSGNGRHAIALAQQGFKVTGVDISAEMLSKSQDDARQAGLTDNSVIRFESHDMRELAFKQQFDGAFCAGNSFGYFTPDDTMRFLQGVAAALKPTGRFLIDTSMAAESFFVTGGVKEWVEVGDILMLIENVYLPTEARVDSNLTFLRNGKSEKRTASHYVHTVGEIVRMLGAVGLVTVAAHATIDGDPFELGCDRLFLVSQKGS